MSGAALRGVVHHLDTGGRRELVRICQACDRRDPTLERIAHAAYLGVHRGLDAIAACDHPDCGEGGNDGEV